MERTNEDLSVSGTKDGSGAADHDEPYTFGRRPRSVAPWPFTERQFARLLVLRGQWSDEPNPADNLLSVPTAQPSRKEPSQALVRRQQARRRAA
jgi:hypothetical protein